MLSLSVFSASVLLPFVRLPSASSYSAFCFFLSSFFPPSPHIGFFGAALSAFAPLAFPVLSDLVSRVFFPGSSYSAFCQFPFVPPGFAPTAVPPVLPFCFRFRAFPSLGFLSSAFAWLLLLSFPFFLFPSSRFPLSAVPSVLSVCLAASSLFLFRLACCHASLPIRYSAYCASFLHSLSRLTVATSASRPSLAGFGLFPFAYALGSGYSASGFLPFGFFLFAVSLGNV